MIFVVIILFQIYNIIDIIQKEQPFFSKYCHGFPQRKVWFTLQNRSKEHLAERGGFEPPVPFRGTHAFQACQLSHSCTSPFKTDVYPGLSGLRGAKYEKNQKPKQLFANFARETFSEVHFHLLPAQTLPQQKHKLGDGRFGGHVIPAHHSGIE